MKVSKFKEGRVHCRNSGMSRLTYFRLFCIVMHFEQGLYHSLDIMMALDIADDYQAGLQLHTSVHSLG